MAFFAIAIQVVLAILYFKLGTLAAFVLIPFSLITHTAFMAERPLGWVVAAGNLRASARAQRDAAERGPVALLPEDYGFLPPPATPKAPEPKREPDPPPPPKPAEPPPVDTEMLKRLESLRREMEEAMDSPITFATARPGQAAAGSPPTTAPPQVRPTMPYGDLAALANHAEDLDHNQAFLRDAADVRARVRGLLEPPTSPFELKAGTIIPAALVTPVNTDLPGDVIGHVTANVFDSITGEHLLVPQGARLIGRYNSHVLNGQNRVLIAWQRLILPNGNAIALDAMPGTDAAGVAGMADRVDYHVARLAGATLLSTLIALGGNLATSTNNDSDDRFDVVGDTVTQQASQIGQTIIKRELDIAPTIMIRAGTPFNVLVNRDLPLVPYAPALSSRSSSRY